MKYEKKAKDLRDSLRRLVVSNGTLTTTTRPCGTPMSITTAYALLELLDDENMTVSELAERLFIDRTNVSRLVLRMEKSGEVKCIVHPTDGRAKVVRLTGKGKTLAKSVDASSGLYFSGLVKILGDSTEDVIEAIILLENALTQRGEENV